MGAVYKAVDTRLGRFVALKTVSTARPLSQQRRTRLFREALAASALNHPNIVTVYDILTHDGQFYIAMEFIEGSTLKELIQRREIGLVKAVQYGLQIADALARTHAAGVVHRDLKPSNIMVTGEGQVKLLDFGLAKLTAMERPSASDETATLGLTEEGVVLGSPGYMSPEQAQGLRVDARSDVFSFGLLLYEMIAGQLPFRKPTKLASLAALLHEVPAPFHELGIECPAELEALAARCLHKSAGQRCGSMLEVRQALEAIAAHPHSVRLPPPARERGSAIAVLPFTNLSPNPDHQYFSDGLAEEIITALSNVRNLRVTARTSAFRFRSKDLDLQEIGEQLKVDYILLGSVRRAGNRLRVTVQLVDPKQDCHLWSERYDRTLDDVFAIQDEIASAVVEALQHQITGSSEVLGRTWEQARRERQAKDVHVHEDYLRGRYCLARRSWDSLRQGIAFFEAALEKDPAHALSKVGLADCYNLLGYYNERPPHEAFPRAKAAAEEAIAINGRLGEAYASLGYSRIFYDRDWTGAEDAFRQSARLAPGYASAKHWKTWLHFARGEFDTALISIREAQQADPLAPILNSHVGLALAYLGRMAEAFEQLQMTVGLDPDFALAHYHLGTVYCLNGEFDKSIPAFEAADRKSGGSLGLGWLGCAYAMSGRKADANRIWKRMGQAQGYVSPLEKAYVQAGLGHVQATFDLLERAYEERSADLVRLRVQPWPKPIRQDPRLSALAERIGLPPAELPRG
jgi:eukaryotic-like serine/threonine-protein kinase